MMSSLGWWKARQLEKTSSMSASTAAQDLYGTAAQPCRSPGASRCLSEGDVPVDVLEVPYSSVYVLPALASGKRWGRMTHITTSMQAHL